MSQVEVTGTILQPSAWDIKKLRNNLKMAVQARDHAEAELALLKKEAEELRLELRLLKESRREKKG